MQKTTINIGTRSSNLAMWQAYEVRDALLNNFPDLHVEIVTISTKGDAILDIALSKIGDKGLFTREIEQALMDKRIDIAVHSLKDLPTTLPEGVTLGGVLPRGEVRDVLISRDGRLLKELTSSDRIGTSSLRRQAQLLNFNPDLTVVDIRGNVNTRIRKMSEGHCDALVMAGAGILRLEMESLITEFLNTDIMIPAVSQGAVAMEIRENDPEVARIVEAINHQSTSTITNAERTFLKTIEGGCQVPVGIYSEMTGSQIIFTGIVASVNGHQLIRKSVKCRIEDANEKAAELANHLLDLGGREILDEIR